MAPADRRLKMAPNFQTCTFAQFQAARETIEADDQRIEEVADLCGEEMREKTKRAFFYRFADDGRIVIVIQTDRAFEYGWIHPCDLVAPDFATAERAAFDTWVEGER